ncbi:hypothetical protein ADICEAN_01953 [Cesiribacter andamanensis AMV16]|uniref:Uncharacterized protein n=1 Tax=Cesiribacter andamanensis AMV16 TaxID=1279009 RepID=M7NMA4_9BACT|nr:hypothetical protein ADICEAN_01953 [Cesiribacter andamanensis AMV16]
MQKAFFVQQASVRIILSGGTAALLIKGGEVHSKGVFQPEVSFAPNRLNSALIQVS